jgi:hypothetical protein
VPRGPRNRTLLQSDVSVIPIHGERDSLPSQPVMAGLVPRLSGWILVDEAHGVDSTRFRTRPNVPGHEARTSAMRHQNITYFMRF